ncbi:MAG: DUF1080 domain-containing protein [Planctomycetota bacterium]|nr:MAG: DUF1080 domain-containing protein [Planctomycetota bacterium]
MKRKLTLLGIYVMLCATVTGCEIINLGKTKKHRWAVHDTNRPLPEVVTPGEKPCQPPSDAIVLFDGRDLSNWVSAKDGSRAKWKVENGYMEVVKKTGDICTKQTFGDCQLHIEWAVPEKTKISGQDRSNSGVYLMSNYEVQVLDSYNNRTYADGQAGAIYGQNPPLVNVSRPPGQWESYDIIFHRPIFKKGKVVKPAIMTVLQNGVLIQDNFEIEGKTAWKKRAKYEPHADKMPLLLQDHGHPVRYRNIWVRQLQQPEICNK